MGKGGGGDLHKLPDMKRSKDYLSRALERNMRLLFSRSRPVRQRLVSMISKKWAGQVISK